MTPAPVLPMPSRPRTLQLPRKRSRPECRPSPSARGYGPDWQRTRIVHLAEHPFCEDCLEAGRLTGATEVDHITALTQGGTNDPDNLMSLCKPCHSSKTCRTDGGLGNRRADA